MQIRKRRRALGLTQGQLGDKIGITFQQVHKHEIGDHRVTAARLWDFAAALDVDLGYFYEDFDDSLLPAVSENSLRLRLQRKLAESTLPTVKLVWLLLSKLKE